MKCNWVWCNSAFLGPGTRALSLILWHVLQKGFISCRSSDRISSTNTFFSLNRNMATAVCRRHGVHGGWDFATGKQFVEWFYLWAHSKHSDPFLNWTVALKRENATLDPVSKKINCGEGESCIWVVLCSLNYVKQDTGTIMIFLSLRLGFRQSSDIYLGWIIPVTAWPTWMPCRHCPSMLAHSQAQTFLFWTPITPTHQRDGSLRGGRVTGNLSPLERVRTWGWQWQTWPSGMCVGGCVRG